MTTASTQRQADPTGQIVVAGGSAGIGLEMARRRMVAVVMIPPGSGCRRLVARSSARARIKPGP